MQKLFLVSLIALMGCAGFSGVGGSAGASPFTLTVSLTITAARAGLAAAQQVIAESQLDPVTLQQVNKSLLLTQDSLTTAGDALAGYVADKSATSQCRLHSDISSAIAGLLSVNTLLIDSGIRMPPAIAGALSGLASVSDAVAPGCANPAVTASARVMAALQHADPQ